MPSVFSSCFNRTVRVRGIGKASAKVVSLDVGREVSSPSRTLLRTHASYSNVTIQINLTYALVINLRNTRQDLISMHRRR